MYNKINNQSIMAFGKREILIILTVILILLMIGFFLYLRIEKFAATPAQTNPSTTPAPTGCPSIPSIPPPSIKSITSSVAEYTIDVEPTNDGNASYFLKYYGPDSADAPAGILAVDPDNKLKVQILNDTQPGLINKWFLNPIFGDKTKCIVSPVMCNSETDCKTKSISCLTFTSLYMDSTILAYLPYSSNKENQVWTISTTKVSSKNILRVGNPSSIAAQLGQTITGPIDISQLTLNQENEAKLKDVLDLISNNLQSYKAVAASDSGAALSQAASTPIKINLSLTGSTLGGLLSPPATNTNSESFADSPPPPPEAQGDVRALLASYENRTNADVDTTGAVYTLDTALGSTISCPRMDSKDWAISRVGQCNCDLSGLGNQS